eukprot:CAMPEP_0178396906 /NCGR_PEP_ID=MMETSP0689_2-20121128/13971_1 /TAXON_ID=160604 /ORGANISM="Amphidinium massartii, Strain CS-259" /LENGTH=165 /DNA_ID=CAMNT_0020017597 /DNA_START=30 /DNA_END=523 /DNA_ORIENTATION=+
MPSAGSRRGSSCSASSPLVNQSRRLSCPSTVVLCLPPDAVQKQLVTHGDDGSTSASTTSALNIVPFPSHAHKKFIFDGPLERIGGGFRPQSASSSQRKIQGHERPFYGLQTARGLIHEIHRRRAEEFSSPLAIEDVSPSWYGGAYVDEFAGKSWLKPGAGHATAL